MNQLPQKQVKLNKNVLLRYKAILEDYLKYKTEDIPLTVIHRKYIYPKYFISKQTLYNVLGTPVNKLLKELENQS